ncbi:glycosyltransferase family 2 protein [Campylobacter sp. 1569]|uniref:glycosyltransferase family 2 protein n=1 Tax=Campylobacter sp. 1569 TaxID=2735746 RepID=UPI00301CDF46|nr:glycosyltransferase family 2 protein [Campylobacter sp. 1569]
MTIVFPMAGLSSRFAKAGYELPKYMLKLQKESVFYNVVFGFKKYFDNCSFLFIYRDIHNTKEFIKNECQKLGINTKICIELQNETLGQAHTVMLGLEKANIQDEEEILIFNIDTLRFNFIFPEFIKNDEVDGYLEVFEADGEQWSFVLPGKNNRVLKTAEKDRISNLCSSGLYYFKKTKDFKEVFRYVKNNNLLVKNEFYIAPMYNYLIDQKKDIRYNRIDINDIIFCGTPQEYERLI